MSCRIDRVANAESLVVLLVSGHITGERVDTLKGVLEQEPGRFVIDLKNVVLVDREAVKLLARSQADGMELRNCPPYIREWVTRETAEKEDIEDA
jgi:anti-anti-sigma regulatory factor